MKKFIALAAAAALAVGLASPSSADETAGTTKNIDRGYVNTSDTFGTGSNQFLDDGVFIRTRDWESEASGKYFINDPLSDIDTLSQDWSGTSEPGQRLNLVVDGGRNGRLYWATLTKESVYGGNLWMSANSDDAVKALAPHTAPGNGDNEGQGSQWYGTLEEWQAALGDSAYVVSGGWVLGVPGRGTLVSQTYGDTTYTFQTTTLPSFRPRAHAKIRQTKPRHAKVTLTGEQYEGTQWSGKGTKYRVIAVNPRTWNTRTVATGRVSGGDRDVVRVPFPKAKRTMQVQVLSMGAMPASKRIRVR